MCISGGGIHAGTGGYQFWRGQRHRPRRRLLIGDNAGHQRLLDQGHHPMRQAGDQPINNGSVQKDDSR